MSNYTFSFFLLLPTSLQPNTQQNSSSECTVQGLFVLVICQRDQRRRRNSWPEISNCFFDVHFGAIGFLGEAGFPHLRGGRTRVVARWVRTTGPVDPLPPEFPIKLVAELTIHNRVVGAGFGLRETSSISCSNYLRPRGSYGHVGWPVSLH